MRKTWVAVLSAVFVAIACGSEGDPTVAPGPPGSSSGSGFGDGGGTGDGGGAAPCEKNEDCASGLCNLSTKTCGCGGVNVAADIVPPNILIVLDRSCSMTDKVGATTKWDIAVA